MRVAVCGMGHLGSVAAACLHQAGIDVIGWTSDGAYGAPNEPNMPTLPNVTISAKEAVTNADVIWLAFDTPLSEGIADTEIVLQWADKALTEASLGQVVLVSSQLPVGSVNKLWEKYSHLRFFCSPENLRRGSAVNDFKNPGRVIIGTRERMDECIQQLFRPFCQNLFWTSIESAEFIKHALNAWLAMSISFANEIGQIAVKHGANPIAIEHGLRSDPRVGDKAYIKYAAGGIGPHLARDLDYLLEMAPEAHLLRGIQRASDDWEAGNGRN